MKQFSAIKKSEWQNYAVTWNKFKPPWVPSTERLKIYGRLINKYVRGKEALILGATPAIRDLLAKLKFNVTILDICPSMVKAANSLKKTKNKERIVIGNWLTADFKNKFDLVMGDSVLPNVHPRQYPRFFQQIGKFLKDDGVFIEQGPVINKKISTVKLTTNQIIENVENNPKYYKNYLNRAYDYVRWCYSHAKYHLVDWGSLERECRDRMEKGELNKGEFNLLSFGFKSLGISLYRKKELEKILRKYWKIIEEKYEKKHPVHRDFYRIYVLKKK